MMSRCREFWRKNCCFFHVFMIIISNVVGLMMMFELLELRTRQTTRNTSFSAPNSSSSRRMPCLILILWSPPHQHVLMIIFLLLHHLPDPNKNKRHTNSIESESSHLPLHHSFPPVIIPLPLVSEKYFKDRIIRSSPRLLTEDDPEEQIIIPLRSWTELTPHSSAHLRQEIQIFRTLDSIWTPSNKLNIIRAEILLLSLFLRQMKSDDPYRIIHNGILAKIWIKKQEKNEEWSVM